VTVGRSPAPPIEATPAFIRRALGPTPQKDGQVLGIFDIALSATPARAKDSPSKARSQPLTRTPSKSGATDSELLLTRTPQSSSRRFLFDAFAGTPLKRKSDDADLENIDIGSATKRRFATPSFLRRSFPLTSISENASNPETTSAAPFKKRSFVRSLSSIIQGLRQQEEERMDEELDMLNELEDEAMGVIRPKKTPAAPTAAAADVLVEDSQAVEMPLGPDKAGQSSEESSDEENTGGFIRKPWKKKGLKRQTRRVIMRPVTHKAPKAGSGDPLLTIDEEDAEEAVQETQDADGNAVTEGEDGGKPSHDNITKSTDENGQKAKTKKMISAQANANFRRLNIKNKNSKAKGKGGRFGRRK
jgi:hypothetical protein